ncbi:MAG: hypothetical protein IPL61_38740 [Myxococcales bacterium]|nr:hypothetical protein [Myxococcales bacterium]
MADEPKVPAAVVVTAGKVPGDVPAGAPGAAPGGGGRTHRKLSNYLLDKRLQLRYVLVVTVVSALIAGTLGFLIYQQEHEASGELSKGLAELAGTDEALAEYGHEFAEDIAARDRTLVLQMVGIGLGLTVILSGFLLIMTHKVAGPLYKVGLYMEKMSDGRVGAVTPLRKGDMLQDFYVQFREAHEAVRGRLQRDAEVMDRFADAWAEADDGGADAAAVRTLRDHVAARRQALS